MSDNSKPLRFWQTTWFASLIFMALVAATFWKLWSGGQLVYGDTTVFPRSIREAFETFYFAWQPPSRGLSNPQTLNTLFQGVLIIVSFGKVVIAQKIFHLLPLVIGFASAHYFLGRFTKNAFARAVVAFFYVVNPATLGTLIGGAAGMLYVHALFPLVVDRFLVLGNTKNYWRALLIFVALFSLTTIWGPLPYLLFLFLLGATIWNLINRRYRVISRYWLGFIVAMAGVFVLNAPFLFYSLPWFSNLVKFFTTGSSLQTENLTNILSQAFQDEQTLNFGLGGSYFNLKALRFLTPINYLVPALAFSALVVADPKTRARLLPWAGGIIVIFGFILATHWGLTIWLYKAIPTLLVFRSPSKLILLMAFLYLPLLAILISTLLSRLNLVRVIAAGAIALLIGLYAYPFWTGDGGIAAAKPPTSQIKASGKFAQIKSDLPEQPASRTLWLPQSYESTELKVRTVDPDNLSLPLGYETFAASPYANYLATLQREINTQNPNFPLARYAAAANNRFIVVDKNPSDSQLKPAKIINYLKTRSQLALYLETSDFAVFENKLFVPRVSTLDKISLRSGPQDAGDLANLINQTNLDPASQAVVFAENQFDQPKTLSQPLDFSLTHSSAVNYQGTITTDQPTLIYLSEAYHPLWQGRLNGQPLEHVNANLHNGFLVPANSGGQFNIKFTGQPWRTGLIVLALGGWLILLVAAIAIKKEPRKSH